MSIGVKLFLSLVAVAFFGLPLAWQIAARKKDAPPLHPRSSLIGHILFAFCGTMFYLCFIWNTADMRTNMGLGD